MDKNFKNNAERINVSTFFRPDTRALIWTAIAEQRYIRQTMLSLSIPELCLYWAVMAYFINNNLIFGMSVTLCIFFLFWIERATDRLSGKSLSASAKTRMINVSGIIVLMEFIFRVAVVIYFSENFNWYGKLLMSVAFALLLGDISGIIAHVKYNWEYRVRPPLATLQKDDQ
jgi:hypothetical protein